MEESKDNIETVEAEVVEETAETTEESKASDEKPKKKKRDPNLPKWVTNNYRIDEPAFCKYLSEEYGFACMNGIFYNYEARLTKRC